MLSDDDDDSDIDHITSYCTRCENYGFLSELGPRIYPLNEPIPHDSDIWLQCYRCGTIISKVHAKHENEFGTIIDPPENIHDSQKVTILPIHSRSKSYDRTREAIKRIDSVGNSGPENDKDLQSMLAKGKQLKSYNHSTS
jgi:hypothetical protein